MDEVVAMRRTSSCWIQERDPYDASWQCNGCPQRYSGHPRHYRQLRSRRAADGGMHRLIWGLRFSNLMPGKSLLPWRLLKRRLWRPSACFSCR